MYENVRSFVPIENATDAVDNHFRHEFTTCLNKARSGRLVCPLHVANISKDSELWERQCDFFQSRPEWINNKFDQNLRIFFQSGSDNDGNWWPGPVQVLDGIALEQEGYEHSVNQNYPSS